MPAGRGGRDLRLLGEKRPLKRAALPLKDPTHRFSGGAARSSGPSLRVPAAQPPGRVASGSGPSPGSHQPPTRHFSHDTPRETHKLVTGRRIRNQYGLVTTRSWAGKSVRNRGPSSVTTTSSSMRAAETPSLAGQ